MVSSSLMTYFSAMWHIWINCNGTHNLQKKNSANAIVEIPQVIWGYNLNRKQMISWIEYDHDSRIMVHICGTRVTSKQYLLSSSCGGKCPWRQAVCTWNRACWRFTYDPLLCRLACGDLASHAFPSRVLKNLSTRSALQRSGLTMMVSSSPLSSLDIISEINILLHFSRSLSPYFDFFVNDDWRSCNFWVKWKKFGCL